MQLTGEQHKQLTESFVTAFPSKLELKKMFRYGLDKKLNEIVEDTSLNNMVFSPLEIAKSGGWLKSLIKTAKLQNPGGFNVPPIEGRCPKGRGVYQIEEQKCSKLNL